MSEVDAEEPSFAQLNARELVIMRQLERRSPLTEFELVKAITNVTTWSAEQSHVHIGSWLMGLQEQGLVFAGQLLTQGGKQAVWAAAITNKGRTLLKGRSHAH